MKHQRFVIHRTVTHDRIMEAAHRGATTLADPGICLACGADADGVEPDARGYECEACGETSVYAAEELAMLLANHAMARAIRRNNEP